MWKRVVGWLVVLGCAVALGTQPGIGQPPKKAEKKGPGDRPDDRAAIRRTTEALRKAYAAGDGEKLAALWTETGEYVDPEGEPIRGRAALTKAYNAFFARNKGGRLEHQNDTLRFPGRDAALAEGTFTRKDAAGLTLSTSHYSALFLREKEGWRVAILRESTLQEAPALKELEWLVGDWSAKTPDGTVETSYRWDEHKAFLVGRFASKGKGGKAKQGGVQYIGRDNAEGVLRSWVFGSDGSFGGGIWTREGKGWRIESAGTLPDGSASASVNLLIPSGRDAFSWQSTGRTIDGEKQPDTVPIKVTRVKGR